MNFKYEIGANEFVAAQVLYHELSNHRKRIARAAISIVGGFCCFAIVWNGWSASIVLALVGASWIYSGVVSIFPAWRFRLAYPTSEVVGESFTGEMSEDGFEVTGDLCSWRVRWPGVRWKGENENVFMLYAHGTIFMFGKKYLNSEQQQQLRKLSGLR
jgi:hypothetical protein